MGSELSKILILFCLTITSCATSSTKRDADLTKYVLMYEATYGISYGGSYYFSDTLDPEILGYGGYDLNGQYVNISKEEWSQLSEEERIVLMFHELTHAKFSYLKHDDEVIILNNRACPKSIMNTYLLTEYCFNDNKDYYFNELKAHFINARE